MMIGMNGTIIGMIQSRKNRHLTLRAQTGRWYVVQAPVLALSSELTTNFESDIASRSAQQC
jgi:hypothetical protein